MNTLKILVNKCFRKAFFLRHLSSKKYFSSWTQRSFWKIFPSGFAPCICNAVQMQRKFFCATAAGGASRDQVFFTFTPPPTLLEIRAKSQINEFIFVARFHCALFRRRTFPKISGHFHLSPKERTKKQCSGKRRGGEFNLCSSCAARRLSIPINGIFGSR